MGLARRVIIIRWGGGYQELGRFIDPGGITPKQIYGKLTRSGVQGIRRVKLSWGPPVILQEAVRIIGLRTHTREGRKRREVAGITSSSRVWESKEKGLS